MKAKIKIMKTRPEITEEEIKTFMDFDALLAQKGKLANSHKNIRRFRNFVIGFACLLAIPSLIFFFSERKTNNSPVASSRLSSQHAVPTPDSQDTLQSTNPPEEKPSPAVAQEKRANEDEISINDKTSQPEEGSTEQKQVAPEQTVYVQAEPIDGYPALYDYFDKNLVYPPSIREPVEGVVDVTFVIDTTGKAINITIENSLGNMFDEEIIRLMKNMPAWRPASYNGKSVPSKISLPITFSLKKTANP